MRKYLLALILLALMPAVYAQAIPSDIAQNISNILVQFSGIIFIIAFVVILLLVGGVFPRVSVGGIPWGTIALLIAILIVMVVPFFIDLDWLTTAFQPHVDQYKQSPLPDAAANVLVMLGLPREWMYVPAIIYFFLLPFAAVFALLYAFLASLNIFTHVSSNNVNRLLAFIIALMCIPTGILARMTMVMFVFLGMWVLAVFFVTFVVGVFYRGAGVIVKERGTYKATGALSKIAKDFEDYANKKLMTVKGPQHKALKDTKEDIQSRIYTGEINKLEDARKMFDDQYDKIIKGGG